MAHIHLGWELGGGLGHAGRLKMLAQELRARGHQVSMGLRDLVHTHNVLSDLDIPKFQAPVWLHQAMGLPPTQGNLAEILFQCGYLDAKALHGLVLGWRALFQQLKPDLLVADYAPTAILAARTLGLRSASVGIGFYSPPADQPLPPLRDWEAIPEARLRGAEAHLLRTANTILAQYGAAEFTHGAQLLLGDVPLLCTWPELDHYRRGEAGGQRWLGPSFLPQGGVAPQWPAGGGRKVFAYLKTGHPDHLAVLQALVAEGCSVLCYLPEVANGRPPPLASPLLHYAMAPVSLQAAFREADLCVCHAGEATLVQALLAGVPVLLLPMQAEQFLMSRQVQQVGAGVNAAMLARPTDWRKVVRQMLDEPRHRDAAQAFAARYSGFSQQAQLRELADVFEANLR
jgi:hypothetical protein